MAGPGFTHAELMQLFIAHGGDPSAADTAAAIALAESGGCQYAKAGPTDDRPQKTCTYRFTTGEDSYGLWQVNRDAHPTYSALMLYDENGAAAAAVAISGHGSDFGAWSTYADGSYRAYLAGGPSSGTTPVTPSGGGGSDNTPPPGLVGPVGGLPTLSANEAWRGLTGALSRHLPQQLAATQKAARQIRHAARR